MDSSLNFVKKEQKKYEKRYKEVKTGWELLEINEIADNLMKNQARFVKGTKSYQIVRNDILCILEKSKFREQDYRDEKKWVNLVTARELIVPNVNFMDLEILNLSTMLKLEKLTIRANSGRIKADIETPFFHTVVSNIPIILSNKKYLKKVDIVIDPCYFYAWIGRSVCEYGRNVEISLKGDFSNNEINPNNFPATYLELKATRDYIEEGKINNYYNFKLENDFIRNIDKIKIVSRTKMKMHTKKAIQEYYDKRGIAIEIIEEMIKISDEVCSNCFSKMARKGSRCHVCETPKKNDLIPIGIFRNKYRQLIIILENDEGSFRKAEKMLLKLKPECLGTTPIAKLSKLLIDYGMDKIALNYVRNGINRKNISSLMNVNLGMLQMMIYFKTGDLIRTIETYESYLDNPLAFKILPNKFKQTVVNSLLNIISDPNHREIHNDYRKKIILVCLQGLFTFYEENIEDYSDLSPLENKEAFRLYQILFLSMRDHQDVEISNRQMNILLKYAFIYVYEIETILNENPVYLEKLLDLTIKYDSVSLQNMLEEAIDYHYPNHLWLFTLFFVIIYYINGESTAITRLENLFEWEEETRSKENYKDIIKASRKMMTDEKYGLVYWILSKSFERIKEYEKALNYLEKAEKKHHFQDYYIRKVNLLIVLGEFKKVKSILQFILDKRELVEEINNVKILWGGVLLISGDLYESYDVLEELSIEIKDEELIILIEKWKKLIKCVTLEN